MLLILFDLNLSLFVMCSMLSLENVNMNVWFSHLPQDLMVFHHRMGQCTAVMPDLFSLVDLSIKRVLSGVALWDLPTCLLKRIQLSYKLLHTLFYFYFFILLLSSFPQNVMP